MYQAHGWFFADQDTHFAHMIEKNIKKGGPAGISRTSKT